jgi:transposase
MMGLKQRAFAPLVSVSLEELVPQDHFYRHLQRVLDLSFVHELVRERYAVAGRPSIDPVVFFKLQLVLFFEDIRSERLLMRHAADRLSVLWYLGYDLGEPLPDHSTLSKIRQRYGLEVFRRFFEAIVQQCQEANLVWGKELYFDSSAGSMPMRIWIRLPLVLRLRREKPSKNISPPFLRRNQHSLKTPRKALGTHRFPNHCQRTPLHFCQPHSPLPSPRYSMRNLPKPMLPGTTGLQREVGNSEKPMAFIGELLTFGSVPPILMPHPCASREEESTWATIHTTSWMEESVASFWQCWSCQGR